MTNLGTSGWLYVAVIIIAALGLMLFGAGLHRLVRRRQFVRGPMQALSGGCIGLIAALVLLVGLNLLTWARFTHEQPVASLAFHRLGPQHYVAEIDFADGRQRQIVLHGDEWQLDARVLKWKNFATLLGFDSLYRVERITGRYANLWQAQTAKPSVVGLSDEPKGISLWRLAHREAGWLPFIDASYGSATYLPMTDGARYQVSISNTGLLARPLNQDARRAVKSWE
jgi:hypothetical protein